MKSGKKCVVGADRNDPDNWLEIPEFDVLPNDVEAKGFAHFIYESKLQDPEFSLAISEMVRAVRSRARKRFTSQANLRTAVGEDDVFALRYDIIFWSLEICIRNYQMDKTQSLIALADAGASVAAMMIESPIDKEAMRQVQAKRAEMLSTAGRIGAEGRKKKYAGLKLWALDQAKVMRGADKDIARRLVLKLPTHLAEASIDPQRLIYDALRAK